MNFEIDQRAIPLFFLYRIIFFFARIIAADDKKSMKEEKRAHGGDRGFVRARDKRIFGTRQMKTCEKPTD